MRWLPFLSILTILIFISSGITGSYKDSAHGNSTYGVYRSSMSEYSKGNCAHCHEMHAGNGSFALFADNFNTDAPHPYSQSDDFCFYCHGPGGITNYDYSKTFGGATGGVNNIMDAFNQASYHNLYDIWNFAKDNFDFFTSDSNPCVACHNPHIAKRSCGIAGDEGSFNASQSAISKPSDHGNLWGDDTSERIKNNYAAGYTYRAPYYDSNSSYEPAGNTIYDGSNMPDYVTFCTDCHNNSTQVPSQILGNISIPPRSTGYLISIDWDNEKHGKGAADGSVSLKNPYSNASGNKVVSCLDCHEPHGAPNAVLIRREVNGDLLEDTIPLDGAIATNENYCPSKPAYSGDKRLGYLCRQCHKDDNAFYSGYSQNRWCIIHHNNSNCGSHYNFSGVDVPYPYTKWCGNCHQSKSKITCTCCHYHGAQDVYDLNGTFSGRTF